jgi:hypothetical protein
MSERQSLGKPEATSTSVRRVLKTECALYLAVEIRDTRMVVSELFASWFWGLSDDCR